MIWVVHALAAPTFRADEPGLAALTTAAWAAATTCTGREPPAYATVIVDVVDELPGGFAGRAHVAGTSTETRRTAGGELERRVVDPGGMWLIRLTDDEPGRVAHEVAHAWVHGGPPALVEGATDLLADCIARVDPGRFPRESLEPRALVALADLRTWTNPDQPAGGRHDGYVAAFRLMVEVARLTPERELWRGDWTWTDFDALLAHLGEPAAPLREALAGGAAAQRRLLGDLDGDRVIGADELRLGTDPLLPDTDGDGWWDGVPDSLRAHRVRVDENPRCLGVAAGPAGAALEVDAVDAKGGAVKVRLLADGQELGNFSRVPPGASLATPARKMPSATWVTVRGGGIVPDTRCWSRSGWFVLADPGHSADLPPFTEALAGVDTLATERLGPGAPARLALGEPSREGALTMEQVTEAQLARARQHGWRSLAANVVAASRLEAASLLEPDGLPAEAAAARAALARWLVNEPQAGVAGALDPLRVAAWQLRSVLCGGWRRLLDGKCG